LLKGGVTLSQKAYPATAEGRLESVHFWLHRVGSVIVNLLVVLMLAQIITEAAMVPIAPISEFLLLLGVLAFDWNVLKNANWNIARVLKVAAVSPEATIKFATPLTNKTVFLATT
jgi:hypothetical protein